jgi:hypothetical protein
MLASSSPLTAALVAHCDPQVYNVGILTLRGEVTDRRLARVLCTVDLVR